MKKKYLFFYCIVILLPCCLIKGQPVIVSSKLMGENVISVNTAQYTLGVYQGHGFKSYVQIEGTETPFVVTANSVYMLHEEVFADYYSKYFTPPPGVTIKAAGVKKRTDTTVTPDNFNMVTTVENLLVLLSDGKVYRITASGETTLYTDISVFGGSQSWLKIKGDDIYALSSSYLYVTKDSSSAWKVDSAGLGGAHIYDFDIDSSQKLYVATANGIFTQNKGVNTFDKLTGYTGPAGINRIFIDRKKRIFVAANGNTLYTSNDDGTTWGVDTTGTGSANINSFADDAYGNVYFIGNLPSQQQAHVFKSAGGTQSWQLTDSSLYNKITGSLVFSGLNGDSILQLGTSAGIFLSADAGKTWVANNNGIRSEFVFGIAKNTGNNLLLSNGLGIYKQQQNDSSWTKTYPTDNRLLRNAPLYDNGLGDIYAIDYTVNTGNNYGQGYLLKTADGGNTWVPDTVGLTNITGGIFFIDEKGEQHIGSGLYGSGSPLYLSQMWSRPKNGAWGVDTVGFPVAYYSFTRGMASDKKGYLYVTGNLAGKKVLRRAIAGGQWLADSAGIPSNITYFDRLKANNGDVIGAVNNRMFHRGTGTWTNIPLPAQALAPFIQAISIDESGYIFVGINAVSNSGVYFTNDFGATWKYAGLGSADIADIVSYGGTSYVLTRNEGAFALTHNSALPVTLSTIKAYGLGKGIQVEWSGYNEINMLGYDVERSTNGDQFVNVGSEAARGNSVAENTYTYFDPSPLTGDNFYRIKAISKNGTVQYSGIVKVNVQNGKTGMLVYPNPAVAKTINVQLNNIQAGKYSFIIYNTAGQRVYANSIIHAGGNAAIAINAQNMAPGVYWLVLQGRGHIYNSEIIIK